ncbi:MAG: DUF6731 family protein [Rhodospirillaceae bacterium]
MTVYLYRVSRFTDGTEKLEKVLQAMMDDSLEARLRSCGTVEVRAEAIRAPRTDAPYWLFDFGRLRFEHGPGRASRKKAIEGFDLAPDEGFGEETAALFVPGTNFLILQYNHYGVRHGTVEQYLSMYRRGAHNDYRLHLKLDDDADARLARKQLFKRFVFGLVPGKLTDQYRKQGVALSSALRVGEDLNADAVEVTVSVNRARKSALSHRNVHQLMHALRAAMSTTQSPVNKLIVAGKDDESSVTEVIDLIAPKMSLEFDNLIMGTDRRFTRDSRWHALERAYGAWENQIGKRR